MKTSLHRLRKQIYNKKEAVSSGQILVELPHELSLLCKVLLPAYEAQ
jgi:hypothetical protein